MATLERGLDATRTAVEGRASALPRGRHQALLGSALFIYAVSLVALWVNHLTFATAQGVAIGIYCILALSLSKFFAPKELEDRAASHGSENRFIVVVQLATILLAVLLTADNGLRSHGYATGLDINAWSAARDELLHLGNHYFIDGFALLNPVCYAVVPSIIVLLLGAKLSTIGYGRFRSGALAVAITWCAVPATFIAIQSHATGLGIVSVAKLLFTNLLHNGWSEESLFRGLLMYRLRAIARPEIAIYLQALVFCLWHAGATLHECHGIPLLALADMGATLLPISLSLGYLTFLTGNIVIPACFHLLYDCSGDVIGQRS